MNRSESIKELAVALAKAQGAMAAAAKDGTNPHYRYRYATLGAIWEAAREPLSANGLAVTQSPAVSQGSVTIETLLMHASGEWVSNSLTLPCPKPEAQAVGAAITYGRKYALAAIVGVAPEDEESALQSRALKPGMATEPQIAELWRLNRELAQDERLLRAAMSRVYGSSEPHLLTESQVDLLTGDLRLQLSRRNGQVTDSSPTLPPSAAAPPASDGSAGVTLQEALAADSRWYRAADAASPAGGQDALASLYSARDSYFGLVAVKLQPGEKVEEAQRRVWLATLAKRGLRPLDPLPAEVIRELTATYERRVAELVEQRRNSGVTCAEKGLPQPAVAGKSDEVPY